MTRSDLEQRVNSARLSLEQKYPSVNGRMSASVKKSRDPEYIQYLNDVEILEIDECKCCLLTAFTKIEGFELDMMKRYLVQAYPQHGNKIYELNDFITRVEALIQFPPKKNYLNRVKKALTNDFIKAFESSMDEEEKPGFGRRLRPFKSKINVIPANTNRILL